MDLHIQWWFTRTLFDMFTNTCRCFTKKPGQFLYAWRWLTNRQCYNVHTNIWFTSNFFRMFTHLNSGSPLTLSQGLHTFGWLGCRHGLSLHTWCFTKRIHTNWWFTNCKCIGLQKLEVHLKTRSNLSHWLVVRY